MHHHPRIAATFDPTRGVRYDPSDCAARAESGKRTDDAFSRVASAAALFGGDA
jgi:hypothetical protein